MNKKNNLLQINMGDSGGGAQQISSGIHSHIDKSRWSTSMIVGNKQSSDSKIIELKSPRFLTYLNLFFGLEYMFYVNTFGIKKMKLFKEADVVHYHNLHGSYFNLLALPMLIRNKPSVWTFHDMWPILGHSAHSFDCKRCEAGLSCKKHKKIDPRLYTLDTSALLYKVKKALLVSADFSIVVPSLWLKRKVEQSFLKDKKIYLVYNGIDTDVFKPYSKDESREELNLPKDKTIVTFASSGGLANTWKGIEYAYAVMNKFSNDDSVMFLSIGGINEEMKKVPNLVQIPYVKDKQLLAKYYSASDIFLSPTLAESFGLTIAEAMSCGTPVVSFGVGAVPELIDHMQNGFIARHKDVEGLAVGMRMLMADAMLAKKMSLSARDKIVEKFNLQKMLDGYESVYSETMATFKNARS